MRIVRIALSSFLLLLVLAAAPLAAAPQDPVVTIVPSDGGRARAFSAAELAALHDVFDRTYTLRAADGSTSTAAVRGGVSVAALLAAAGLELTESTYAEIPQPDGSSSALLVTEDLVGTDEGPPVVWSDERGVHVLRPSDGEQDVNTGDLVTVPVGPLSIQLRTGDPVKPRIHVSKLRARLREPIEFRASLAVGSLRPGMGFAWYFDGGANVPGANVSHRFTRTGEFTVLLYAVRGGGDVIAVPAKVVVRIMRARRDTSVDEGEAGRDSAVTGGGAGSGGSSTAGGGSGTTAGGVSATPVPVTPSIPAPAPRPPAEQPTAAPPAQPRGELVSGTLLAAVGGSPAAFAGAAGPSGTARATERDAPLDIPVGAWVAIGLAALLALGWALESRHTVPFWQP